MIDTSTTIVSCILYLIGPSHEFGRRTKFSQFELLDRAFEVSLSSCNSCQVSLISVLVVLVFWARSFLIHHAQNSARGLFAKKFLRDAPDFLIHLLPFVAHFKCSICCDRVGLVQWKGYLHFVFIVVTYYSSMEASDHMLPPRKKRAETWRWLRHIETYWDITFSCECFKCASSVLQPSSTKE